MSKLTSQTLHIAIISDNKSPSLHQVFGIPFNNPPTLQFSTATIKIGTKVEDDEPNREEFSEYKYTLRYYKTSNVLNISVYTFTSETPHHLETISSYLKDFDKIKKSKKVEKVLNLIILLNVPKRHIHGVKYILTKERCNKYFYLHGEKDGGILIFTNTSDVLLKTREDKSDSDVDDSIYEINKAFNTLNNKYEKKSAEKLIEHIHKLKEKNKVK